MSNARVWLFRVLVIIVAGLMVWTWFQPWWSASVDGIGEDVVTIHPYGLEENLGALSELVAGAKMPGWFAPLMWTFLGLSTAALLFGLFAKEKSLNLIRLKLSLPKVIIGGIGLIYIVFVVAFVTIAAIRSGDFYDMRLIGDTFVSMGGPPAEGWAHANLLLSYWLACAVGPLLVILALFRNKIAGKTG